MINLYSLIDERLDHLPQGRQVGFVRPADSTRRVTAAHILVQDTSKVYAGSLVTRISANPS